MPHIYEHLRWLPVILILLSARDRMLALGSQGQLE